MKITEREYRLRLESTILSEADKAQIKPHPLWHIVLFPLVYIGSMFVGVMVAALATGLLLGGEGVISSLADAEYDVLLSLFTTLFPIGGAIAYVRFVERRSMASMGFVRRGWLRHYGKGFGAGIAMCAVALLIVLAMGGMEYTAATTAPQMGLWLLTLVGFMVQGMSEEVMLRGYLTVSLANRMPVWLAVALSSVLFAFLHGSNAGLTPLSLVNLVLFGIFAALLMLRYDNIWGIGALHSAWNFCQGNIFGVAVSGSDAGVTLLNFNTLEGVPAWIGGGGFGLEASVATTIVFGTLIVWLLRKDNLKQSEISPRNAETLETKQ
ncbi:MAG: CPBP family intramembrane metalloprotease [Tidjanibacter sp.]|nr:CPBP family intramembrane metalloprotease [Tidjanibacter sp.]MBR4064611.1 CPBP family intramembrane metalloprotease [Tidjanibacter sp.]